MLQSCKPRALASPPIRKRPLCKCLSSGDSKKVVVVGAGWAGFGAAKHLTEQGYDVTLLDAAENPGGLAAGWRTKGGKAVEAGTKGFWYQYHNIFALLRELGGEWPLTEWTSTGFWDPDGLVTSSPVFSSMPRLPTMLGQFVYTVPLFRDIPLADRVSMLTLLANVIDYDTDAETYAKYDEMTARELFRQAGLSQRMYDKFIKPILLVGLFAPPEDISAAECLGAFYFYTLAHQNDFDVCWCKGSIAERVFAPMMDRMRSMGGRILGSHVLTDVSTHEDGRVHSVSAFNIATKETVTFPTDAVVLSIGVTGMQKLVSNCSALGSRPEFRNVMALKGLDVMSTRLWLDRQVNTKFPSNVVANFDQDVGGTYFNLNMLQDEYRDAEGTVIAADFYHSNTLMPLTDDEVTAHVKRILDQCEAAFKPANVVDSAVLRFPKAVTHFSPGSLKFRPRQQSSFPNLFIAGDWVRDVPHGANGLSQERAYVTGLLAANLVVDYCGKGVAARILDVEPDEPYISTLKQAAKQAKQFRKSLGLPEFAIQ